MDSSWGSGAGCVRVDHTCGTWCEGTLGKGDWLAFPRWCRVHTSGCRHPRSFLYPHPAVLPGLCPGQLRGPEWEVCSARVGRRGGAGAVCVPPPQPGCGRGLYVGPPPHPDWWMGLYHGDVGAVCCQAEIYWYESFPPRARWSLSSCMSRFFEADAAGVCVALILRVNQSAVNLG